MNEADIFTTSAPCTRGANTGNAKLRLPRTIAHWLTIVTVVTLSLVGQHAAASSGPPAKNRFGIYFLGPAYVPVGQALGVSYQRKSIPIPPPYDGAAATIASTKAAGFHVIVTFSNICRATRPRSCPVNDVTTFEKQLNEAIINTRPDVIIIENEEDGTEFTSATPAAYIQELTYSVQVAHAHGFKVANGGMTTLGLNLAYWHYLWQSGQWAQADQFAASAFYPSVVKHMDILGNIPNSSHPTRPILANIPALKLKLQTAEFLISAYKSTGADYVNFHWYQADGATMMQSVSWLESTTGLPAMSNEMGQFFVSNNLVVDLLSTTIALNLAHVIWFASDGPKGSPEQGAYGLANADGSLRVNGLAFKSYISTHP